MKEIKSCLNCLYHGLPVSTYSSKERPCGTCIKSKDHNGWKPTDKNVEFDVDNSKGFC